MTQKNAMILVLIELQKLETQILKIESNHNLVDLRGFSFMSCNNSFYSNYGTNSEEKNSLYNNIHVISSSIYGLGKSTKIRNEIIKNKKKYIYFPLGGDLTKNIIYTKLDNVLKTIITKNDYKNITIHFDLFETEDDSILNEFLFSLLITKFYSNNENIIYIPKEIEIYVEIPNCFTNFISKYGIFPLLITKILYLKQIILEK